MKVKKDKFLKMACADLDMVETATRTHYGYKSKSSTATDASYTIAPKAHVASRIGSSKRRGFMSARPNSVQKGTQANKSDSVKAMLGRKAKKSMRAGKSYVSTAEGEYNRQEEEEKEEEKLKGTLEKTEEWVDETPEEIDTDVGITDVERYAYTILKRAKRVSGSLEDFARRFRGKIKRLEAEDKGVEDPKKFSTFAPGPKTIDERVDRRYNKQYARTAEEHDRAAVDYISSNIPIAERQARAAKGEDIIKTERDRIIAENKKRAMLEEHALYMKEQAPGLVTSGMIKPPKKVTAKKMKELKRMAYEMSLFVEYEHKPLSIKDYYKLHKPKKVDDSPKDEIVPGQSRIPSPRRDALPPYSPEESKRLAAEPSPFEHELLTNAENESRAWSIMQWIADGNAGKIAQDILLKARNKENKEYEERKLRTSSVFDNDYSKSYTPPSEWEYGKNDDGKAFADIIKSTKNTLTPEQQKMVFSLVQPSLPFQEHKLTNVRARLLESYDSPAGKDLFNRIAKQAPLDPMETGAGYVFGPEGAKARKERYLKAQAKSEKWPLTKDKQWGRLFDRDLSNRAKDAQGVYSKTPFDRDISNVDDETIEGDLTEEEDNVASWEGKKMGQQPRKPSAQDVPDDPPKAKNFAVYRKLKERLESSPVPIEQKEETDLRKQIRSAMYGPEIRYKMEQYVAIKERMGELVDRDKIRFLVALKEVPGLKTTIDGTIPGGVDRIIKEIDDTFARGNAELFANPMKSINPNRIENSGVGHVGSFRRYLSLLRHTLKNEANLSAFEQVKRARNKDPRQIDSGGADKFLSAYKNAISDVEGKIWENRDNFDALSIRLREGLTPETRLPDTEIELLEQQLNATELEHQKLLNTAAAYTQKFFHATRPTGEVTVTGEKITEPVTEMILKKIYGDGSAPMFEHNKVQGKQTPERIAASGAKVFNSPVISPKVYQRLFPKRFKENQKRERELGARENVRKFVKGKGEMPIDQQTAALEQRYRQVYDTLPQIYNGMSVLKKLMFSYPKVPKLSLSEAKAVKSITGTALPSRNTVVAEYKKLNEALADVNSKLPKSMYTKFLKGAVEEQKETRVVALNDFAQKIRKYYGLTPEEQETAIDNYARQLEKSGVSEVDQALMVRAVFPGTNMAPESGGILGHKPGRIAAYRENALKEDLHKDIEEDFLGPIPEGMTGGQAHHQFSKERGQAQYVKALEEIVSAYREAALTETKGKTKQKNLVLGNDGKSFVFEDKSGTPQTVPYSGNNLLYADTLEKYMKINQPGLRKLIEGFVAAKKDNGELSLEDNMRFNIAKLIYATANADKVTDSIKSAWNKGIATKDIYGTPKSLDQELWEIGFHSTGHGPAGTLHNAFKTYLPDDKLGFKNKAIENNVASQNWLWERYHSKIPDETRDVSLDLRSPAIDARSKLQTGARNAQEEAENEVNKRLLSEINPPKTLSGETPRAYDKTLNRPDYEQPTSGASPDPKFIEEDEKSTFRARYNPEGLHLAPGGEAIKDTSPPAPIKQAPYSGSGWKPITPKLGDLGNVPKKPFGQSDPKNSNFEDHPETADVVDKFLSQNKKLELHTQGGDGSGESPIGISATWHGLYNFLRKGAKQKMKALMPMSQQRTAIAANMVPQTNAKNNKPPVDPIYSTKPGGGAPGDILSKYLHQINGTNRLRNIVE